MRHLIHTVFFAVIVTTLSTTGSAADKKNTVTDSSMKNSVKVLAGTVAADGSSTVFPITEAVAEEYRKTQPKVRVTVGLSGTGGGMKKFTAKTSDPNNVIDLTGASRPIKPSERALASESGVNYIELPVAYDGIAIVVNKANKLVNDITTAELNHIWRKDNPAKYWSDIRKSWPKEEIKLYGPGTDSGTFDYFKNTIVGKKDPIRSDFAASEDDNVIVRGVNGYKYSLGYFGYAYYIANQRTLKVLAVDGGNGPIMPSEKTIELGTYAPLSRPVFIYVNAQSVQNKPQVRSFVEYYLSQARSLVPSVGYVPFKPEVYVAVAERLNKGLTGTVFGAKNKPKGAMKELLALKGE